MVRLGIFQKKKALGPLKSEALNAITIPLTEIHGWSRYTRTLATAAIANASKRMVDNLRFINTSLNATVIN